MERMTDEMIDGVARELNEERMKAAIQRTLDWHDRQPALSKPLPDAIERDLRAAIGQTKMKTVRNLMSGKMVEIPEDTPLACDPSSETYWSM